MSVDIGARLEGTLCTIAVCAAVASVFYMIVVVWWTGLNDNWLVQDLAEFEVEKAKIASCYAEYGYSEIREATFLTKSYCGEGQ